VWQLQERREREMSNSVADQTGPGPQECEEK
jgi:hypothetical protein